MRMMRLVQAVLTGIAAASTAAAGHVYGIIRENNRPIRNVEVSITCGKESGIGHTDQEGVYRLFLKATGNCQVVMEPRGRRASGFLYSYDRPTAYDFDLVRDGGRWVLRRR